MVWGTMVNKKLMLFFVMAVGLIPTLIVSDEQTLMEQLVLDRLSDLDGSGQHGEPEQVEQEVVPQLEQQVDTPKNFVDKMAHVRKKQQQDLSDLHQSHEQEKGSLDAQKAGMLDRFRDGKLDVVLGKSKKAKLTKLHADHSQAVQDMQATHQLQQHRLVYEALDDLFKSLSTMFVSAKPGMSLLGLEQEPQSAHDVHTAFDTKHNQMQDLVHQFDIVKSDPIYDSALQDTHTASKYRFAKLYGKESHALAELQSRLQASKDLLLELLGMRAQIHEMAKHNNLYTVLDSSSTKDSAEIDQFYHDKLHKADKAGVSDSLQHDVAEAKQKIHEAHQKAHGMHHKITSRKTPSHIPEYQLLGLGDGTLTMKEIHDAHDLKKRDVVSVIKELSALPISNNSYLYKLLHTELSNLQSAKDVLHKKAHNRIETIIKAAHSANTATNNKLLLGLSKVTTADAVSKAYQDTLHEIKGAGDTISGPDLLQIEYRVKEAKDSLLQHLANMKAVRDTKSLSNWQLIGLHKETTSIKEAQKAFLKRLQQLHDQQEIYKDQAHSQESQQDLYSLQKETEEVKQAAEVIIQRLKSRIESLQSLAHNPDSTADLRLLGDVGIPMTRQSVEEAFDRTIQEVDGAGDMIPDDKISKIKGRVELAKDRLLHSLGKKDDLSLHIADSPEQRRSKIMAAMPDHLQQVLMPDQQKVLVDTLAQVTLSENILHSSHRADKAAIDILKHAVENPEIDDILEQPGVSQTLQEEWKYAKLGSVKQAVQKAVEQYFKGVDPDRQDMYAGLVAWAFQA